MSEKEVKTTIGDGEAIEAATVIPVQNEESKVKEDVVEVEEVAVAKPKALPTLYVRNLNEKIKLEGKCNQTLSFDFYFFYRTSNQLVPSLFDLRRSDLSEVARD